MGEIKKFLIKEDEYNFSIPLKTINGESLQGEGNLNIAAIPGTPALLYSGYKLGGYSGIWKDCTLPEGWKNHNSITFLTAYSAGSGSSIVYGLSFTIPVTKGYNYYFKNSLNKNISVEGQCNWDTGIISFRFGTRLEIPGTESGGTYYIRYIMGG